MKTINSISEAYSQQPISLRVGNRISHYNQIEGKWEKGEIIDKIILEGAEHYNGYSANGDLLFSYRYDSVNVHFNPPDESKS